MFLARDWQPAAYAGIPATSYERFNWIGTLGNPGYVGTFLALPALLAVQQAVASRRRRVLHLTVAVLLTGVLVGTRTLTALIAFVAGLAVILWQHAPRRLRLPIGAATAAALALLLVLPPVMQRVKIAVQETRSGGWVWLGSARLTGWASAANMIAAYPLTGVGYGLYEANSFRHQNLDVLAERGRVLGMVTGFGETHNDPLQHVAETGVVGALLALAGAALAWRRRSAGDGLLPGVRPLAAAGAVLALTQFPLHLATVSAQWAVLAALALPALPAPAAPDRRGAGLALALVAAAALVGGGLAWQRYTASCAVHEGVTLAQTLRQRGAEVRIREAARPALAAIEARAGWLPFNWEVEVALGNLAVEVRDFGRAQAHFVRALALAERPEVRFDVGMAALLGGEREAALAHLVRAVELNPAVFREIKDATLSRDLRTRLDTSGYGAKHAWMYEGTPAATP
jgi:hypothetical protein